MGNQQSRRRGRTASNQNTIWLIVFLTAFALAVGISTGLQLQDDKPEQSATNQASSSVPGYISDPAGHQTHDPMWPQIADVAEHFLCGCGECGDMRLVECTCDMPNGGIREKGFIRQQLAAGHPVEHVVSMVEERFGRRIPSASTIQSTTEDLNMDG